MKTRILILGLLLIFISLPVLAQTPNPPASPQTELDKLGHGIDKITVPKPRKETDVSPVTKRAAPDPALVVLGAKVNEQQVEITRAHLRLAEAEALLTQQQNDLAAKEQVINKRNKAISDLQSENEVLRHNIKRSALWRILTFRW